MAFEEMKSGRVTETIHSDIICGSVCRITKQGNGISGICQRHHKDRKSGKDEGGTGRSMMMDVDKVKRTLTMEQIGKDFPLQ